LKDQNREILKQYIEEVWNNGNVSLIEQFAYPDYIARGLRADCLIEGYEGIKQNVLGTRAALKDLKVTFKDIIAEGDRVASRIVISGINVETGKNVIVEEMMIHQIIDGKIKKVWSIGSEQKEINEDHKL
jgi:predicted ester cyclase